MIRPALIIFAKAPVMGQAKTRLAADIGPVHAKRIYRAMTARIIRNVQDPRWDTALAVTPATALGDVPDWSDLPQFAQVSGSLSPRLSQVFSHSKGRVVVIGTDCPQVRRRDIADALSALLRHDAVFGPAADGGFWLMAMNGPVPAKTFDNVRWSSADTLSDIASNVSGSIAFLRTLTDVDDLDSLIIAKSQLVASKS